MKFFNKKGFTLTELVVAVTLSSILLIFVFKFVADTINILSDTTRKSRIFVSFYEFVVRFDNYRNTFPVGSLVKDFFPGSGYDVIMLKTFDNKAGVIFGVVNKDTMQLDTSSNYQILGNKVIGFRELTQADITNIGITPDIVYTYTFFQDKVFTPITKDFQADFYNGGNIIDMNVGVVLSETNDMQGGNWSQVPQSDVYKVNLSF